MSINQMYSGKMPMCKEADTSASDAVVALEVVRAIVANVVLFATKLRRAGIGVGDATVRTGTGIGRITHVAGRTEQTIVTIGAFSALEAVVGEDLRCTRNKLVVSS